MNEIEVRGVNIGKVGDYRIFVPAEHVPEFMRTVAGVAETSLESALSAVQAHSTGHAYNPDTHVNFELIGAVQGIGIEVIVSFDDREGLRRILELAQELRFLPRLITMYDRSLALIQSYPREDSGRQLKEVLGGLIAEGIR